jgi:hypothetical protein
MGETPNRASTSATVIAPFARSASEISRRRVSARTIRPFSDRFRAIADLSLARRNHALRAMSSSRSAAYHAAARFLRRAHRPLWVRPAIVHVVLDTNRMYLF